jgi:competence protein ComFB
MGFYDRYDFSLLVNEKEKWVIEELEAQLKAHPGVCRCQECVLDMTALALNHTKSIYRVTLLGALYTKSEDEQTKTEIHQAVEQAVKKVFQNPSHIKADLQN